ncbi:hypothetical protein [Brevifollis gellanilyticus]|uniref:Uncharacterized protein n=1 Tax=Brevifollis gellanilyticus TaxID=748831 RepID=A0A512M4C1_9BACT|nr:hypothetical protein [Brevifollis gellanilyticus]GEP41573.1 hypothetical protein BGE01nite_08640 [Brevifollis gellanilyticus]
MIIRQFVFIGSLVANVIAAVFFLSMQFERIGGRRYDPSKPRDLGDLRRIIYSIKPLQVAMEEHRQHSRVYPEHFDELAPKLKEKHFLEEVTGSDYVPRLSFSGSDSDGYQIHIKLGWDPGLYFYSAKNEWVYDPGDGSDTTVIEP